MKRRSLTRKERDAMLARQNFACAQCHQPAKSYQADHFVPVAFSNEGKPDALLCGPCHAVKTVRDVRNIAKAKRLRYDKTQHGKRLARGTPRLKSGPRKIKSRGFITWLKKKMNGKVERRDA